MLGLFNIRREADKEMPAPAAEADPEDVELGVVGPEPTVSPADPVVPDDAMTAAAEAPTPPPAAVLAAAEDAIPGDEVDATEMAATAPAAAAPVLPTAALFDDPGEAVCLICLEEDTDEQGDRLLSGICACRTTAIHHSCLDKLVNSRQRRQRAIHERMACAVCTQPYKVPYQATVLQTEHDALMDDAPAQRRRGGPPWSIGLALVAAFASAYGIQVLVDMVGRQVAFLVVTVIVFAFMLIVVYGTRRPSIIAAPAAEPDPSNPETMDDDRFYRDVVLPQREVLREHGPPPQGTLARAKHGRVILHTGMPGEAPPGATAAAAVAPRALPGDSGAQGPVPQARPQDEAWA